MAAVLVHDAGEGLQQQDVAGAAGVDDPGARERRQLARSSGQGLGGGVERGLRRRRRAAGRGGRSGLGSGPGDGEDGALDRVRSTRA